MKTILIILLAYIIIGVITTCCEVAVALFVLGNIPEEDDIDDTTISKILCKAFGEVSDTISAKQIVATLFSWPVLVYVGIKFIVLLIFTCKED